jgi:O-antigen/teichoic acid export membrane protein
MTASGQPAIKESTYRSLLRHSAAYSVPVILGKMCSFFLLPVYTRYLSPADYGVLELLDLTSFMLTSLLGARLGDALCYFHAEATSSEARGAVATTAFFSALAMGIFGALTGFLVSEPLGKLVFGTTAYTFYFHLVFANFVMVLPLEVGLAYLRALNRSVLFTICMSVRLVVAIFFNVLFLAVWKMGIAAMLWSTLAASAVMGIGLSAILLSSAYLSFDFALCRRMAAYTVPVGVGGVAMLVIHYGDRFFLQRSATLADVGIYSLAYKLGMLVSYVQLPFVTYWTSQMYRIVRGADGEAINARVCTYLVLVLTSVAVVITMFSRPVLYVLTPRAPAFREAALFIPLIAAAYVIRGFGDQVRNVFFMENRTVNDAQTSILGCLLCLAGYGALIPPFKMWGAAVATLCAFIGMTVYSYWKTQRIKRYHYEVKRLAKIGVCASVSCAAVLIGMPSALAAQFAAATAGLLLFVLLLVLSGLFEPSEIETVKELRSYLWQRATQALAAVR